MNSYNKTTRLDAELIFIDSYLQSVNDPSYRTYNADAWTFITPTSIKPTQVLLRSIPGLIPIAAYGVHPLLSRPPIRPNASPSLAQGN